MFIKNSYERVTHDELGLVGWQLVVRRLESFGCETETVANRLGVLNPLVCTRESSQSQYSSPSLS